MDSKIILLTVLMVAVLAVSVVQMIQINNINSRFSSTSNGAIDMTGWTETEKMNYDHHGTLPARLQGSGASQAPTMVGGC